MRKIHDEMLYTTVGYMLDKSFERMSDELPSRIMRGICRYSFPLLFLGIHAEEGHQHITLNVFTKYFLISY